MLIYKKKENQQLGARNKQQKNNRKIQNKRPNQIYILYIIVLLKLKYTDKSCYIKGEKLNKNFEVQY